MAAKSKLKEGQELVCVPCGREIVITSCGAAQTTIWCCGSPMAGKKKTAAKKTVKKKPAGKKATAGKTKKK